MKITGVVTLLLSLAVVSDCRANEFDAVLETNRCRPRSISHSPIDRLARIYGASCGPGNDASGLAAPHCYREQSLEGACRRHDERMRLYNSRWYDRTELTKHAHREFASEARKLNYRGLALTFQILGGNEHDDKLSCSDHLVIRGADAMMGWSRSEPEQPTTQPRQTYSWADPQHQWNVPSPDSSPAPTLPWLER